jgi:large subunit ribosomal protein L11
MAKQLKSIVKINIKAGKATPAPPIGPSLAPHGINISEFCSKFNEATRLMGECTVPAEVRIYQDRTFEFKLKTPLTSELIKKALGIPKGSGEPNKKKVGKITQAQLKEIAEKKLPDLNTKDINQAIKIVSGTAKNMGVNIE